MTGSGVWSMDRVAASTLLTALGLDISEERLLMVAGHFARHRDGAQDWAASRAHDHIAEKFEEAAQQDRRDHGDDWHRGFSAAEEIVLTLSPQELLGIDSARPRSKGQALRTMMRAARQS